MSNVIGSNLRKGMRPGGFTSCLGTNGKLPARKKTTAADVRAAANAALERRGMRNAPTYVRDARHESMFEK